MTLVDIIVGVLLSAGVAVCVLSCIGLAVVSDVFDRLHFMTPASMVAPVLIAAAIVIEESASGSSVKAIITALLIIVTSPVIGHATARAARVRQFGHWQSVPEEEVDTD